MSSWLSEILSRLIKGREPSAVGSNTENTELNTKGVTPEIQPIVSQNDSDNKKDPLDAPTVVLVDYDNVLLTARRDKFQPSFKKLREHCRKLGKVVSAEIFVPPYPLVDEAFIRYLGDAGFVIVACPAGIKDKDRVDSFIQTRGIFYATHTNVARIVVISEDGDFSKNPTFTFPIRDTGKELVFLKPSELRQYIAVDRRSTESPPEVQKINRFQRAISSIREKQAGSSLDDRIDIGFMTTLIAEVVELAGRERREYAFKTIASMVWTSMNVRWSHRFCSADVTAGLAAIINEGILVKKDKTNASGYVVFKYYRPNSDHPVLSIIKSSRSNFSTTVPSLRR